MSLIFENSIYIAGGGGGSAGNEEELTKISEQILGSQEQYLQQTDTVICLSGLCDTIIGQTNTSNVYNQTDLDRLKNLENLTDNIIGV